MAGQIRTVEDLVSEVRSLMDEDNEAALDTQRDILPSLNRAQDVAANILARHYESPLLAKTTVATTGSVQEYSIPEDAFEERLEKIEATVNGLFYPVKRVSYRDISQFETTGTTSIPEYYAVVGNKYRLVPAPNGTYSLRVWYLKSPPPVVLPQGRITVVNAASNYILVDVVGSDLTTETDNLNSYANIVDGQTGLIKASMQIKTISDTRITFKSTPARSTVLNTSISSDLAALETPVEPDDYICVIKGSCVPFFKTPFSNYLVQYAVAELTRKLGGSSDLLERVKEELMQIVERSWVGREQTLRVSKENSIWGLRYKRGYNRGN